VVKQDAEKQSGRVSANYLRAFTSDLLLNGRNPAASFFSARFSRRFALRATMA